MSLFDKSQRIGDGQGFIQNESTSEINPANLSATNEQDSHNGPQILGDPGTFFESNQQELSQDPSQIVSKRFSVGIDLGTTHCVVSYAEIADTEVPQQVMAIPQLTLPGTVEESFQLPSFLYQAHEAELAIGSTSLPWTLKPDYLVGEIARNLGSKTPIRLVSSAKSWLCHAGVDCKSPILPVNAPEV